VTWAWAAGLSGAGVHDGSVTVIQRLTFTTRGPRVRASTMAARYQARCARSAVEDGSLGTSGKDSRLPFGADLL